MSEYDTGNPVPSASMPDAWDNMQSIDMFANSSDETITTRTGKQLDTLHGINVKSDNQLNEQQDTFELSQSERESSFEEKSNEFESRFSSQLSAQESTFSESQSDKENRFQQFLNTSGYVFLSDYQDGPFQFSARNQYIRYDNQYYRLNAATDVGFTTTGTDATSFASDVTHFVLMDGDTLRQNLGSGEAGMGSALLMHHTGKSVAEYLDLYLATVFFITPEQYGAKGDTVQDDSDALEDAINKAVATSLMSGGVYTPVVVQLNKPYRITRTITIDASRVRLNAISGCGVYVDPDGTYTDNKVFNITGSGPNAAVAASKVGALFDGVLFLTSGEKKLDLFHAVRDSTASNDNGACLHNVSNIAARGFRTIFTHGAGGWGWNFIGCLFSGNINLMDIITAGDTYERHTFVGCLWGNGGYAFKMNNPNGKIYWTGGSVDYCDGLAQIAQGHMEVNGHNEWTARDKPIVEITGSNASVTVSGTMFVRGNTDTQYYMFQQYQKRQVTLKDTVFITDGVNTNKGLISNLEVVKSNLTFPNDAAKIIAYHSSDESLLTSNNAVVDFSLSATANHTVSVIDGKLTVTAVAGGTTSHLYIDIPVMGNTKVGFKLVASNTSPLGAISLNKALLTLSKRQISDLSTSGTASWPASAASVAGGSVTLFDIPRQAAFLRLDFNVANLTTGTSFIIESLKMFTY
ncbi:hypothetical protein V6100_29885 [Klebsiella pneumoniae]